MHEVGTVELSVVMPCLSEAETLAVCIRKAKASMRRLGVCGEVVVADNGSTDGSLQIAVAEGARVVSVPERGYGAALIAGIEAACGEFVLMADADDSYALEDIGGFLDALRAGADLVMGNRFRGGIEPGAMPGLHRYLGNPVLSTLGRLFFRVPIGDFHCGIRAFRREAILGLDLRTPGMEFASEMVVRAALAELSIVEVPTTLRPDGRSRKPHLRSWRDGWRHLRFLLAFSPRWLLLYPALALTSLGGLGLIVLAVGTQRVAGVSFSIQTMLACVTALAVGSQLLGLAVISRIWLSRVGLLPEQSRLERLLASLTLERAIAVGATLVMSGLTLFGAAFWHWRSVGYGNLDPVTSMQIPLLGTAAIVAGTQMIFVRFVLDLSLRRDFALLAAAVDATEAGGRR